MKISYDGGGEKDPRIRHLYTLGIDYEQKNHPQGCPDWVVGIPDDADAMVELKWSRQDFVNSYESGHLAEQLLYGHRHSRHMLLAIHITDWYDNPAIMEKKYIGMKASIMADFQTPIVENENEYELVKFIIKWLEKCLDNRRMIITEHHIPPIYKGNSNEKLLMNIKGIREDRAQSIIKQYGNVGNVLSALKGYTMSIPGIGPETVFSMTKQFIEWGLITQEDVWNMPMQYAIDKLGYKGKDKKMMAQFNRIKDLTINDDGYIYDRLKMLVEQGR